MQLHSTPLIFWIITLIFIFNFSYIGTAQTDSTKKNIGQNSPAVEEEPFVDLNSIMRNVVYPEQMRRLGIQGRVVITTLIDSNDKITKYTIPFSSCYLFNQPVVDAVYKGIVRSGIEGNKKVACWVSIPVTFRLKGDKDDYEYNVIQQLYQNYDKLIDEEIDDEPTLLYLRGLQFYNMGLDSLAELDYNMSVKKNHSPLPDYNDYIISKEIKHLPEFSTNLDSMLNRGDILVNNYSYKSALETYSNILSNNPRHGKARYQRALCWWQLHKPNEALLDLDKLLQNNSSDTNALYLAARINMFLGNDTLVQSYCNQLLAIDSMYYNADGLLALSAVMNENIVMANSYFQRMLQKKKTIEKDNVYRYNPYDSEKDLLNMYHENRSPEIIKSILINIFNTSETTIRDYIHKRL